MLTAAAWPRALGQARWLLRVLVVLAGVAVAQLMGLPVLKLIGELPGLRIISANFWGGLVAAALTIALGIAVETARLEGLSMRVTLAAAGVILASLAAGEIAIRHATFPAGAVRLSFVAGVGLAAVMVVVVVGLVWYGNRGTTSHLVFAGLAVMVVAGELLAYQNHLRAKRTDVLQPAPAYLTFLYDHLGNQRTLDAGRGALPPNWGEATGIRQIESLDVMQIPWYRDFFQSYIDPGSAGSRTLRSGRGPGTAGSEPTPTRWTFSPSSTW